MPVTRIVTTDRMLDKGRCEDQRKAMETDVLYCVYMLIDGRAISARDFERRLGQSEMREIFHVRVVLAGIAIGRG